MINHRRVNECEQIVTGNDQSQFTKIDHIGRLRQDFSNAFKKRILIFIFV